MPSSSNLVRTEIPKELMPDLRAWAADHRISAAQAAAILIWEGLRATQGTALQSPWGDSWQAPWRVGDYCRSRLAAANTTVTEISHTTVPGS